MGPECLGGTAQPFPIPLGSGSAPSQGRREESLLSSRGRGHVCPAGARLTRLAGSQAGWHRLLVALSGAHRALLGLTGEELGETATRTEAPPWALTLGTGHTADDVLGWGSLGLEGGEGFPGETDWR